MYLNIYIIQIYLPPMETKVEVGKGRQYYMYKYSMCVYLYTAKPTCILCYNKILLKKQEAGIQKKNYDGKQLKDVEIIFCCY